MENQLSEHRIWGWIAASAAGSHGQGLGKRNVVVADTGREVGLARNVYGETATKEIRNSEFESNGFKTKRADFLSAPCNFLVQRFHYFESECLSKEFLDMDFRRRGAG